jgi:hydrogenase/urease accessory protein HupE
LLAGIAVLLLAWLSPACAHEVRPAYLSISEDARHHYELRWKQPNLGDQAVHLVPRLSNGWLDAAADEEQLTPRFLLRVWHREAAAGETLEGQSLRIEGLERTITDVLVEARLADGRELRTVLKPRQPEVVLGFRPRGLEVTAYLGLGVEHILGGVDHLLFVLGLMLLVRQRAQLLQTITAFTVAHSLTLAGTALGWLRVQPALVEVLVALSIVCLALELVRAYRGQRGIAHEYPGLIAFSFGLLHGSAFAGALADVGLPRDALALSLLLFNLGVELGQLLFIAAMLIATALLRRLPWPVPHWTRWIPPYAIGSCSAFWSLERLHGLLR